MHTFFTKTSTQGAREAPAIFIKIKDETAFRVDIPNTMDGWKKNGKGRMTFDTV